MLEKYKEKRKFSETPEPKSKVKKGKDNIYVIQKHDATHLHFDLRLGMDGVLKSWAIPKGPPEKIGVKRLAVQTEDHPVDYASFKGIIPEGQYGAGKVEIWDNGFYDLESKKDNKIVFIIKGKKLKGRYCLLRFTKEKKNWLFFKLKEKS